MQRALCNKSGVIKKNPVPQWKKVLASSQKKLARLRQRVRNLSVTGGMPALALMHITNSGSVKIVGTERLVAAVKSSNIFEQFERNMVAVEAENHSEEVVDLREISLNIDFMEVRDANLLRRALTQVVIDKGSKGSRSVWGNLQKRPSWWGSDIEFVAPSTTLIGEDGVQHRILTTNHLGELLSRWKTHVIQALEREGNADSIATAERGGECPSNSAVCCKFSAAAVKTNADDAIAAVIDSDYCMKHLEEIVDGKIFSLQFSPSYDGNLRRSLPGVPQEFIACGAGVNLFEVFGGNPLNLALTAFAHGMVHVNIYEKQMSLLGETGESLQERFHLPMDPESAIHDVILMAAKLLLRLPGRPCLATTIFIAGALRRELTIFTEKETFSSPPCPCAAGDVLSPVRIYVDRGDRAFPLVERAIFGDELLPRNVKMVTSKM